MNIIPPLPNFAESTPKLFHVLMDKFGNLPDYGNLVPMTLKLSP